MRISIVLVLSIIITACGGGDGTHKTGDFVISGLGVDIQPYNEATGYAGDFKFETSEDKVFLEFAAVVSTGGGSSKALPTFEYRIDPLADVMAIADSKVIWIREQSGDYEIGTRSTYDPDFYVFYDHVKQPLVNVGDVLVSGQQLGKPGTWSATLGRFEIMINNDRTGLSYCPFVYFADDLKLEFEGKITRLMLDWETFKGNDAIYDETSHFLPGCLQESMVSY